MKLLRTISWISVVILIISTAACLFVAAVFTIELTTGDVEQITPKPGVVRTTIILWVAVVIGVMGIIKFAKKLP